MGNLIEAVYREGLQPLMDKQETEYYTIQTVLRASTRGTFEDRIGKQRYAIAVYEKLGSCNSSNYHDRSPWQQRRKAKKATKRTTGF